jgi:hypothetical protein
MFTGRTLNLIAIIGMVVTALVATALLVYDLTSAPQGPDPSHSVSSSAFQNQQ